MNTIEDIMAANAVSTAPHFFSPSTLEFFRSRILPAVTPTWGGEAFFITSEQFDDDAPRLYTVRKCREDGTIETVGEFQGYATEDDAARAVRLEYLRGELRGERISWGEIHELQCLAPFIPRDDLELCEAAGVPEEECY